MNTYFFHVSLGVIAGIVIGMLLGSTRHNSCQARVSSQYLDSKFNTAEGIFR
jgi:hypothetical protein